MPALCSFTDLHSISLLLYKSSSEFWYKTYPYVYSSAIFSSSFSEDAFYQKLFTSFCDEHSIKLADCDVLLSGFLEAPQLGIHVTLTKSIYEVFSSVKGSYPILINNTSIFTPDFCHSNTVLKPKHHDVAFGDTDEDNYYANLEIYPQLLSNEISTQIDIDSNIISLIDDKSVFPKELPFVFCGSRFTHTNLFTELDFLLMLGVVNGAGVFDIKKDSTNSLLLATLLNIHDQKAQLNLDLGHVATLVASPSSIECTVQIGDEAPQLLQVEKGKIHIVNLPAGKKAKLMLKSRHLGTIERIVEGSNVGIIFDTRVSKNINAQDIGTFTDNLKSLKDLK